MFLFRYGPPGAERPGVRHEEVDFDLSLLTDEIDGSFLESNGLERVADALDQGRLQRVTIGSQRIGPPTAQPPAVVCIGQNYAAHAAESGSAPPAAPVLFYKHPGCIVGPYDDVHIPPGSNHTDWEVELAVVVKRTPQYLTEADDPLSYVAGYTISNDVSEREFQLDRSGGQWSKGKSAPTFNPLGPFLRPAWEVDPGSLRLRSWVNGEARQDSTTADMIFSVGELIAHLSHYVLLMPGDVINTGTPSGVALSGRFPYLTDGDCVELEVADLGRQRQQFVAAASARTTPPGAAS